VRRQVLVERIAVVGFITDHPRGLVGSKTGQESWLDKDDFMRRTCHTLRKTDKLVDKLTRPSQLLHGKHKE
jgi:hypothetical protein